MKRPLSTSAYIIGVVANAWGLLINLINCSMLGQIFSLIDKNNVTAGQNAYFYLLCINFSIIVCAIIINSISIGDTKSTLKRFKKNRMFFCASIIFSFIEMAFIVTLTILYVTQVNILTTFIASPSFLNTELVFVALLVSVILAIFDLSNEKQRRKLSKQAKENSVKENDYIDDEEDNEDIYVKTVDSSSLEKELSKLNEMKDMGLINEEDFNKMKQGLVSKYIGG